MGWGTMTEDLLGRDKALLGEGICPVCGNIREAYMFYVKMEVVCPKCKSRFNQAGKTPPPEN